MVGLVYHYYPADMAALAVEQVWPVDLSAFDVASALDLLILAALVHDSSEDAALGHPVEVVLWPRDLACGPQVEAEEPFPLQELKVADAIHDAAHQDR